MSRESDRIDELEAKLDAILARLPKLSPLEELFPGLWRKSWSGARAGWEEFSVQGDQLRILATQGGVRTTWTVSVVYTGGSVNLQYTHTDAAEHSGFSSIGTTVTRQSDGTLSGTEQTAAGQLQVTMQPIAHVTMKPKPARRSREFWNSKVDEYRSRRDPLIAKRNAEIAEEQARANAKNEAMQELIKRADERQAERDRLRKKSASDDAARPNNPVDGPLAVDGEEAVLSESGPDGLDVGVEPAVGAGLSVDNDPE